MSEFIERIFVVICGMLLGGLTVYVLKYVWAFFEAAYSPIVFAQTNEEMDQWIVGGGKLTKLVVCQLFIMSLILVSGGWVCYEFILYGFNEIARRG